MRKTRFPEHQIIAVIKSVEAGQTVRDVCREAGISEATYYIYGLPPFCKYRIWYWVVAYIYPASGKPVPKWVIRTYSPQQLDGF